MESGSIPALLVSASIGSTGKMHISLTNVDHTRPQRVEVDLMGYQAQKVSERILTAKRVQDRNTFEDPVRLQPFYEATLNTSHRPVAP